MEARILALRHQACRGPVFLSGQLGFPASTIGRVVRRHHVPALAAIDLITGAPVRRRHSGLRYEHARPGELLHVDVKKLGRVPDGGGGRLNGRDHVEWERYRGRGIATTSCTSRSMTTRAWPHVEAHGDERDARVTTNRGTPFRKWASPRGQAVRPARR